MAKPDKPFIQAEEYKAPKFDNIEWKSQKTKVKKDSNWVSDYKMQTPKAHPEDLDENAQERKPSSGDDAKPKFWDFKSVK